MQFQVNQGSNAAHALPSLLSILNSNKLRSIPPDSVVNASTINLICNLLSSEDYVSVAEQLSQDSDVKNLVDFMLHLLRDGRLPNLDETLGIKRRARRLMLKIITRIPVIPPSLIVTGVNMPEKRDYIGSGGFGRIFKGELEGAVVALKVLYKSDSSVPFCREALMWRSLTHRLVLPFLGIYELEDGTAPQFFLVSPYMTNGNLAQWRKKANPSVAEVEERILEVAQGMEYIHSEGAVHGDLRGENILLDANLHVQIADFGLTRLSEATNTQSGALHLNFAAPELFGFSKDENDSSEDVPARTHMSDVYAFGCFYYEIHYDSIPFAGKLDTQIWALIFRGTLPPRLDEPPLSDGAWSVIQSCWMREASRRPRMEDIAEKIVSMTRSVSLLPIETRDSIQELFELQTILAQTLTVTRQELDRIPTQMTPTERVRTSSSPGLRLLPQPRSASPPRPITAADLSHPDETQILRQSVPSSVMTATTVATAVSSILDNGRSPSGQNKFGTIRTVTTDLTFEVPSLSRAEGNIIADDMAWRKSQESGSKSRGRKRLSKAPPAHLTRIAEEPEESVVDNPVLMPRDISRRRETSPDGFPPPPKVVLRRHSAKPNAGNRNAIYVPRSLGDTDDEEDDPGVPFPRTRPRRTVSGGASPLKESPSNRQRFNFPRGRFRSEVEESLAARRHMHPTEVELSSFRSRFESMVRSRRS